MKDEISPEQDKDWQTIQRALRQQPQSVPSPAVYERILAGIGSQREVQAQPARSWPAIPALAIGLVVLAIVLLWQALPPGLVLQWSVDGLTPSQFQIYRASTKGASAPAESDFVLLGELEARPGEATYEYVDMRLLPGQSYAYRLEALDDAGLRSVSQTVVRHSQEALLGQVALLAALVIALGCVWLLMQPLLSHNTRHRMGAW